jgi:CubicO group peptidase (beta-lactamase class C family)/peptidoglycan/LPS O-acetylase OafA/YrhL
MARSGMRDGFLDVVRSIATLRVIVWHAVGSPIVSYLIAAMPAMFFVSGALFCASADRRPARAVVADRLRRIAPPLWLFVATVWTLLALRAPRHGVGIAWHHVAAWLVPVVDPPANAWEGGWVSSPLWFLRALLWILLLAPVLVRAMRYAPRVMLGVGVVSIFVIDAIDRSGALSPARAPRLGWMLGDLALYGTFFLAGIHHHRGGFDRWSPRRWIALGALSAGSAGLWLSTQPVPLSVVNNSHPLHLLVGVCWLSVAFALRSPLASLAVRPLSAPVVATLSRRSLTIYLWHTTAIVVALRMLDALGVHTGWTRSLLYATLIAGGTTVAVGLFGWAEDLGARRRPELWPRIDHHREPIVVRPWHLALAACVVAALVVSQTAIVRPVPPEHLATAAPTRPPIPSQQPPRPRFERPATIATTPVETDDAAPIASGDFPLVLQSLLDDWARDHGVDGVIAGVRTTHLDRTANASHDPGSQQRSSYWVAASGVRPDGTSVEIGDDLEVQSATKLFTASLVYRAVDAGLIDLDAPLPPIDAIGDFPHREQLTPRLLMMHRSGLVNYRDTTIYNEDPTAVASAVDAVRVSLTEPLKFEPGSDADYASTNYLILGLLLEQVTGRSFDDLFNEGILVQLGLGRSSLLASEPGEPRHATSGLVGPMEDLLAGAESILTDGDGVSEPLHRLRIDIDPDNAMGAGSFGFCPCVEDESGARTYFGIGYTGGHTWLSYVPSLGVTVGIDVFDTLSSPGRYDSVNDLATLIARTAARVVADPELGRTDVPAVPA